MLVLKLILDVEISAVLRYGGITALTADWRLPVPRRLTAPWMPRLWRPPRSIGHGRMGSRSGNRAGTSGRGCARTKSRRNIGWCADIGGRVDTLCRSPEPIRFRAKHTAIGPC